MHVFEAWDASGDRYQRCRMCKQTKVEVWDAKKRQYALKPLIKRSTLVCVTCNQKHGQIAFFCGPACYHAWPAHRPAADE